jgi:hypothetical protein
MATAIRPQPVLTDEEWGLVIELLERERRELPTEIHHTATREMRHKLRARLDTLDRLLERLGRGTEA